MPTIDEMQKGKKDGILQAALHIDPPRTDEERFSRADLVFTGVDHSSVSYEVRVYLNNPEADESTPRTEQAGYGGRFVTFAHGGCYGDEGHCDVPGDPRRAPHDLRPTHSLVGQTKVVTITRALQRVLESDAGGLESVSLVPVSMGPQKRGRGLTADLFQFAAMELRTFAHATASELGMTTDYS